MGERQSSFSDSDKVLVLGAGPCGLGASSEMQTSGYDKWNLIEAADSPGGLASSLTTDEGFTFDIGGHVLFSHYREFDEMCDRVCPEWLTHGRNAYIYMRDRFIPYPLQKNFGFLPPEEVEACLAGLQAVTGSGRTPENFEEWLRFSFGDGLYESFMGPYNYKVWAYPPSEMNTQWMGERVAEINSDELEGIANKRVDTGWGPNATFRYPKRGGTGAIWLGLAEELDQEKTSYGLGVVGIDAAEKEVALSNGSTQKYDFLVSTLPLDNLLRITERTGEQGLTKIADRFKYSSTHVIGVGMEGEPPKSLQDKSWMYFPEGDVPFYRATVLSNYSPHVVPEPGSQWSLLLEVSESPRKKVSRDVRYDAIEACRRIGFIPEGMRVVSGLHKRFEHGYPTPFLERDSLLNLSVGLLEKHGIYSRGRFGGWKYEVSNQDHTYMQGVEVARRITLGGSETTYPNPEIINAKK